ncbi:MAG: glucose-6-phosphate isomerase [Pseudomonadota bacterium]
MFKHSIAKCLSQAIGENGLSESCYQEWLQKTQKGIESLRQAYQDKTLELLQVPSWRNDIAPAQQALDHLLDGANTLVFFGTGGSSLGGQVLVQLKGWGQSYAVSGQDLEVCFFDNLDPHSLDMFFETADLERTRFVVTSKSGGTGETLTQAVIALNAVQQAGLTDKIPQLFLGITEPYQEGKTNGLLDMFGSLDIPMLEHSTKIGGRYSVLTNVGLLPALAFGLDVIALRQGAQDVLDTILDDTSALEDIAPAVGAALSVGLAKENGIQNIVMMPYADRLQRFAAWYVQLWAESLGKQGEGITPIAALGPVDQHSQLQLYMDGPANKMITFLRMPLSGTGPHIEPDLAQNCALHYMSGRSVGDLVQAQQHAVAEALTQVKCPVRTIDLMHINERTLGALLMSFMLETILAADLLGIDPFDQPGVELGKKLAREKLKN